MTDAERTLWSKLRGSRFVGHKFRRQQPIGPYIVDFLCAEAMLIVEADGSQHLESDDDLHRDAYLNGLGYRILRLWNNDILSKTDAVKEAIYAALLTSPPPRGGAFESELNV